MQPRAAAGDACSSPTTGGSVLACGLRLLAASTRRVEDGVNGTGPCTHTHTTPSIHPSLPVRQDPITFDDVAGVDEAKEELKEIVVGGGGGPGGQGEAAGGREVEEAPGEHT